MLKKQNLEIPLACGTYTPITIRSPHHVDCIFMDLGNTSPGITVSACLDFHEVDQLITNLTMALNNSLAEPWDSAEIIKKIGADQFKALIKAEAEKIPAEVAA